jgi:hypothetical protein
MLSLFIECTHGNTGSKVYLGKKIELSVVWFGGDGWVESVGRGMGRLVACGREWTRFRRREVGFLIEDNLGFVAWDPSGAELGGW